MGDSQAPVLQPVSAVAVPPTPKPKSTSGYRIPVRTGDVVTFVTLKEFAGDQALVRATDVDDALAAIPPPRANDVMCVNDVIRAYRTTFLKVASALPVWNPTWHLERPKGAPAPSEIPREVHEDAARAAMQAVVQREERIDTLTLQITKLESRLKVLKRTRESECEALAADRKTARTAAANAMIDLGQRMLLET